MRRCMYSGMDTAYGQNPEPLWTDGGRRIQHKAEKGNICVYRAGLETGAFLHIWCMPGSSLCVNTGQDWEIRKAVCVLSGKGTE